MVSYNSETNKDTNPFLIKSAVCMIVVKTGTAIEVKILNTVLCYIQNNLPINKHGTKQPYYIGLYI